MTDRMEVSDMGRKKKISDQRRLYTERMRLQKGVCWRVNSDLKLLEYCEECLRIFFLRDYLMILKMITN